MTTDDLDAVLAIEQACFARPWTYSHFLAEIEAEHSKAVVAERNGHVVGYLCLSVLLDEAEILDIAVDPSLQRCGIGAALLGWACDEALQQRATVLRLEVRATSLPALALYERHGFIRSGLRRAYYENNIDAVLMDKNLIVEEGACSLRQ